jgi:Pyruvate/2-oxoacid:ferredoxin oxidoreductase gamma subunit
MKKLEAVNDFVIKFANVNGSGSASANELFAKAILRMGVPVSPRNIFPSNIQGLPTWYEVRVSERGWLGRRGGIDMMVAMNPQTWDADVREIEPGGYLFYDSTRPLPAAPSASDINRHRHAADRDLQRHLHRPAPAPAVQEHHVRGRAGAAAGHRAGGDRDAVLRAVQGQGEAARVQRAGAAPGPRLRASTSPRSRSG